MVLHKLLKLFQGVWNDVDMLAYALNALRARTLDSSVVNDTIKAALRLLEYAIVLVIVIQVINVLW